MLLELDWHIDQWNRIENPKINLYIDFWQGCQDHSLKNKIASSTSGAGTTGYSHAENDIGPLPHNISNINSKGLKDLNVRAKILRRKDKGKSLWHWIW